MNTPQAELSGAEAVFNLHGEAGVDPARVIRERLEAAERAAAAREYEARMQRKFSECPGFIGGDPPAGERGEGRVVVEPALALEARAWLKRRFHVADEIEAAADGLSLKVIPRQRKKVVGVRRCRVSFAKPAQFELNLEGQ